MRVMVAILAAVWVAAYGWTQDGPSDAEKKAAYVEAVTRGEGFMPWQTPGPSEEETAFRRAMEERKDAMLAGRTPLAHPVLVLPGARDTALQLIDANPRTAAWFNAIKAQADALIAQGPGFVERMIPELTPTNTYGTTCPQCVGVKSQEGEGHGLIAWTWTEPESLVCTKCGQRYPDPQYPETATLIAPRMGQSFTFYLNDAERAQPEDRSGKLAYHWVGYPIHVSFTGLIRENKVQFMQAALEDIALSYWLTQDPRYGELGVAVLVRFAKCYRNWLYHDYWDTYADCDPLYAAWHDKQLPLEWKRHLCAQVFDKDSLTAARMEQSYWGAGRIHPSTDSISALPSMLLAYDLLHDAPRWTPETRAQVERDFFLEFVMGAEPFVGGADKAENVNNKSPRLYNAFAAIGKCLGLPGYADVALRGYEGVRDKSFLYDGFSKESPAYTNMYLSQLIAIPETLHGFEWPAGFPGRSGRVDCYSNDPRLAFMFRAVVDQRRPDGRYLPLSDTNESSAPSGFILDVGARRYPEWYVGLRGGAGPANTYTLLNPLAASTSTATEPPEIYFPAWMNAILRHGAGTNAAVLSLPFSPPGGHRHSDNLALFYSDGGATVLGDHGYVGDMPVNQWIRSTRSHNLVVVDDGEQNHEGRVPSFEYMAATPEVSLVQASSNAYPQCARYQRAVLLLKGPEGKTIAVDIFRVSGGRKHAFRVFSELASSDNPNGQLVFNGIAMPDEPPLPQVGSSLAKDDIFGLRDVRSVTGPPAQWQAMWKEDKRACRLWLCSPVSRAEASNGPGQQSRDDAGRRVRYVDAVREGENLESVFVAVHEPMDGPDGARALAVERLEATAGGPDAVALRIESAWGTYHVLNAFSDAAQIGDLWFQGAFGIAFEDGTDRWTWSLGASTLRRNDNGFDGASARWSGTVTAQQELQFSTDTARPEGWPLIEDQNTAYVRVFDGTYWTGFPVSGGDAQRITVDRFPLPVLKEFDYPALRITRTDNG
ncbi:MAG: heparinase II/III family protein [Candidatus Hydrogenedentes bacterium]|nr:heparinase II/III family protein [Candidatus Hydrogenedentota bacterium]